MKAKKNKARPVKKETTPVPEIPQKFLDLLKLEKIEPADLEHWSAEECLSFDAFVGRELRTKKGLEWDAFFTKVEGILTNAYKLKAKETNHAIIMHSIAFLLEDFGRMPTQLEIAKHAELSRYTVHKHLKEYQGSELLQQQMEQYQMLAPKIIDRLFVAARHGDTKAAKIYLDSVVKLNTLQANKTTVINTQNNYVQINNTVLNQEILQQLKPEQLKQIEEIINTVVKGK